MARPLHSLLVRPNFALPNVIPLRPLYDSFNVQLTVSFTSNRDDVLIGHVKLFRHWGREFALRRGLRHEASEYGDAAIAYGVESIAKFDTSRMVKFSTFARPYVERSLLREFHRQMVGCLGRSPDLSDAIGREQEDEFEGLDHDDEPAELKALHPKTRQVAALSLQGLRVHQIAKQTGLKAKEVAFHVRQAAKLVQKRREEMAGPSLFDEVCDALGT